MLVLAAALGLAYVPTSSFDYPIEALEKNEQGVSVIAFQVNSNGHPFGCRVVGSSGSASIDRASCPVVLKPSVVLLPPAGVPLPYEMTKRIRWQITGDMRDEARAAASTKSNVAAILAGWLMFALGSSYLLFGATLSRRGRGVAGTEPAGQAAAVNQPLAREVQVLTTMLVAVLAMIGVLLA